MDQIPPAVLEALFYSAALIVVVVCIEISMRSRSRQRLVDDTPTCKAAGAFIGFIEVKGSAESEAPLTSYLSESTCVYFKWQIEEQWRRRESYTDSKGRSRTRTRTGWSTVASNEARSLFYVKDDSGVIRIDPDQADITGITGFRKTCARSDELYYEKGPAPAVSGSTHRRRFTEYVIPLHTDVYAIGQSRLREDFIAAEIAFDEHAPMYVISAKGEKHVSRGYQIAFWGVALLGLGLAALTPYLAFRWLAPEEQTFLPEAIIPFISGFLLIWFLRWTVMVYNSLIALGRRVRQSWHNIEIELRRRADLVPQIEQITKTLAQHDKVLQTRLAHLRSAMNLYSQTEATVAGPVMRMIVEDYPVLSATDQFRTLTDTLRDTENRIALARGYYNDSIGEFNERIESFPNNLFRVLTRLNRIEFFHAESFEREPVEVNLAP